MSKCLQFLRPCRLIDLRVCTQAAYEAHLRFYSISRQHDITQNKAICASFRNPELQERIRGLQLPTSQLYPRIDSHHKELTCRTFLEAYNDLVAEQSKNEEEVVLRE